MEPVDDKAEFVNQEPPAIKIQKSAGTRRRKIRKTKKRRSLLKRRKTA